PTTRSRGPRTPSCTAATRRSPTPPLGSTSPAGSPPTAITTWTRWSPRRSRFTPRSPVGRSSSPPRPATGSINVTVDPPPPLELWGGVECTVNRVGDRYHDQLHASGHHHRPGDIDLLAGLGLKAVRYPVLWERTEPALGRRSFAWADARLARL